MDLYIYYRVAAGNTAALAPRVSGMQQRLSREFAVPSALKRRPGEKDGCQTWMEIYQAAPAGFEAALELAVMREGLADLIDGPRHTEIFVDVASCA